MRALMANLHTRGEPGTWIEDSGKSTLRFPCHEGERRTI